MTAQQTTLVDAPVDSASPRPPKKGYARIAPLYKALIWTSFIVNAILIILVGVLVGITITQYRQIASLTENVRGFAGNNVSELQDVVAKLQGATIRTTIPLDEPLPLKGSGVVVPVDQETDVILTQPVPLTLQGADIDFGPVGRLRANNIYLELPQGTPLRIALKMNIPLDDVTIPVRLNVPVNIPLKDTELGPQFQRLGAIVDRLVQPAEPLLIRPVAPPDSSKKATQPQQNPPADAPANATTAPPAPAEPGAAPTANP